VTRVVEEAYEVVRGGLDAPLFLSCEHASERLPAPFVWPPGDQRLVGTHWAFDLGARELTLELAEALNTGAVLSRFTRLLADPNRPEDHGDLFREVADGEPVLFNRAISPSERALRIERYHRPYHAALDAELGRTSAPLLLAIHTFTPLYEGRVRTVELGVLFDREERAAEALGAVLSAELPGVAYNEPWSGKAGLMYSCERHAEKHGRVALELEVRQDLAVDPAYRARLIAVLARHFSAR
jgi:predicted N-formylglutamate amidohydrolase